MMKQEKLLIPLESEEQSVLFEWLDIMKIPAFAIANGGSRNKLEAVNLKKQGVKAGVPDMCIPVARSGYHGLYIEMKRQKGGKVSPEQKEWIELLNQQGYKAEICCGFSEAKTVIERYLELSLINSTKEGNKT